MAHLSSIHVVAAILIAALAGSCASRTGPDGSLAPHACPSAADLLDRYAANQDKLKSFVAITDVTKRTAVENASGQSSDMGRDTIEFRYDNSGGNLRAYYGTRSVREEGGASVAADRGYSYLWDGKRFYQYWKTPAVEDSNVFLSRSPQQIRDAIAILYDGAGPILGILHGDLDRFDSILRHADSTSVRKELETVGPADCYVLDAKSKHGNYTVWLDPQHDYSLAKVQVYRGPEHLRFGRPRSSYETADDVSTFALSNVRFGNVEGVWIPLEIDCRLTAKYRAEGRAMTCDLHYAVAKITLNPDHVKARSFVLDIKNGTRVRLEEPTGVRHVWKDGQVVESSEKCTVEAGSTSERR